MKTPFLTDGSRVQVRFCQPFVPCAVRFIRTFGLLLRRGLSAWLVPSVVDVWRVSGAVLLAALVIAVSALLGRRELWAALQELADRKFRRSPEP